MKFRLILKGRPGSGKTALLIRALSDIRLISGGYVFLKLVGKNQTVPGVAKAAEAAAACFPREDFPELEYSRESYFRLLEEQLEQIRSLGFGYMDQILGAELENEGLSGEIEEILSEEIPVVAVLGSEEEAGNSRRYHRLLEKLKEDENTEILDLDSISQEEAIRRMRDWAETVLDWVHHKKFDPLMQLRGGRKRQPCFSSGSIKSE